ncbi:YxeA family protein [Bacillus thuringiensis]|uniref:YxeA family protein n=4 Tax=Bacillus thuringiensis TaxID=1428 RepID=A0AB35PBJ3_BACTU|nr:YxeA family protein [Bacillus thuringiensis]EAO56335.1 hypothetical protein RBTH_06950 [Bacillus thuringiensis serovar israelensis ATCC 35646]KAA0803224.1 YxeA family protein [Bacillus sp. BB56-3]NVO38911.1 YxeA family protein [Bacillus thuringiensis serovar israelensis]KAA8487383.1 YxeA family protein [Bacillus thuringiensis]MCC4008853.1 YxeA family protein [Bacillus thuringiensis]
MLVVWKTFCFENTMKFNKFIQHKRVVGIPAQNLVGARKLGGNKGFEYTVKAYDEKGEEKEVTFDGVDKLQKGSYWHVITRGKFLHDKVEIEVDKIPDGAKAKLGL